MSMAALLLLAFLVAEKVYAAPEALPCAEEIATYCGQVQPGAGRILVSMAAQACNSMYATCKGECVGCFADLDYVKSICVDKEGNKFLK
jgi:hypothetical protein